ncbi:uncharacterized protein LOC132064926 [Lycium ferocissimum]|uniref:uncharacterized protein LOC132064926 n=1 Tax=Lycium ferocissimum TaxID=112874 RepID=UPI002816502C|nr:uncharacterized protein LOC132064926 [Lycium ferocissimum]
MKAFFWNIRSVNTQKAFHRVQMLHRHLKFFLIAFMEPFLDSRHIDKYKRRLGMQVAGFNCNGKIWFFVNDGIEVEVLMNSIGVTLKLTFLDKAKWGDFNVILHEEEMIGGFPVHQTEVEDFAFCKNSCDLQDIDFRGSPFTWWNGRAVEDCIFKRLDRILVNNQLQEWLVEQHWNTEFVGDAFITFKLKMKKLKAALSVWSKETFSDIFKQLTIREDIVKIKEQLFEENPCEVNRMVLQQAQAEFKRYMHFEEEFWKQKAGVKWQSEGDRNTRFFHSLVNGRRKRMQLNRIQNDEGAWLEDRDQISAVAIDFYQQQFSSEQTSSDYSILEHVRDIIGADVYNVVKAFFDGQTLPKSVTHTNLVLLPKKEIINNFSDLRPISLSNFINKIITKVIHDRLESILPSLISQNQSDFVKGRNIIENVLLTQAVVADIRKRGRPANVVIKLDMAKAYDRSLGIFASADQWSLQRIIKILYEYEAVSGQKINAHKSDFYMYKRISNELVNEVQQITGFSKSEFPFTYLGCPVFHARKQKIFYRDMIKKVRDKLQA